MSDDVTVAVLREIRDGVLALNHRVDDTNERLDRLERRQTETELRLATELTEVAHAVHRLTDVVRADRELRSAVDDHERRLRALEDRRAG